MSEARDGAARQRWLAAGRIDGLGRRLLIGIVAASSIVTLVITAVEMMLAYRDDIQRIETSLDVIESSYGPPLANGLWTFDETQVQALLAGLATLPDMEYVQVVTAEGTLHAVGQRRSARTVEKRIELTFPARRGPVSVGTLTVIGSVDQVIQRLFDRFLFVIASNALKTFLVAGFALFLFHRLVSRHLNRIATYAEALDLGEHPDAPLVLDRRPPAADSLSQLEGALNGAWRRLAEEREQLHASERRFRDLVEGSLQGIMVHDERRILYANAAAADILGYREPAALLAVPDVWSLVADGDREQQRTQGLARLAGEPAADRNDARWQRPDGAVVVVASVARTVNWFGQAAVQSTFIDITASVDAERRLRAYQSDLERQVEQRTAALRATQDELVTAERLSTIGRMTATVSHELRNPLGTLSTSIATLRRALPDVDEHTAHILERIDRSIWRCTAIIDDLLEFVHVPKLVPSEFDLDPWAERVLADFDYPPGVTLIWRPGLVGTVRADARRLEQCVSNLVNNACQCMVEQHGKGHLTVATRRLDGRIELAVTDSGPGVPEALRQQIFEPLFSTRGFGIGLGLPLVRQIMEQHEGGVEIRDVPGAGACFVLWLPATQGH